MRIWLNKGFSASFHVKQALEGLGHQVFLSYNAPDHPFLWQGGWLEPRLEGSAYIDWCLNWVSQHGVQVFFPQKEASEMWEARALFAQRGCTVIAPGDRNLARHLADKAAFMQGFSNPFLQVPPYRVFQDLAGYEQALAELADQGTLCIKPVQGIYGSGFRILRRSDPWKLLLSNNTLDLDPSELRRMLQVAPSPTPLLLMTYLEGLEYSVDVASWHGEVGVAVTRAKEGRAQRVYPDPTLSEAAVHLAQTYGLSGVWNFQAKEHRGQLYILEINARMSGGLYQTHCSGVVPHQVAIQLAFGEQPQPQVQDVRVWKLNGVGLWHA